LSPATQVYQKFLHILQRYKEEGFAIAHVKSQVRRAAHPGQVMADGWRRCRSHPSSLSRPPRMALFTLVSGDVFRPPPFGMSISAITATTAAPCG
jgi:hypothetical protein